MRRFCFDHYQLHGIGATIGSDEWREAVNGNVINSNESSKN